MVCHWQVKKCVSVGLDILMLQTIFTNGVMSYFHSPVHSASPYASHKHKKNSSFEY